MVPKKMEVVKNYLITIRNRLQININQAIATAKTYPSRVRQKIASFWGILYMIQNKVHQFSV